MYKTKILVWVVIILLLVGGEFLVPAIKSASFREEITIQINGDEINNLSQKIPKQRINGYKVRVVESKPKIIFSDKDEKIEGYSKHSNYLYSPLCLYVDCKMNMENQGFISVSSNNNFPYKVDLKEILLAMEKDKNWEDLGFHDDVLNGKVNLYIAGSGYFREETENLFYLTLNDGSKVDDTTRKELKPRVDAILKKCVKVADLSQAMENKYKNPEKERIAFVAPEYFFNHLGSCTSSGNTHSFVPVYFKNTVYLNTYIYIADDMKDNESVKGFVSKIKEKKDIFNIIGWRANESDIDVSNISSIYLVSP